jgi:hypothetical protein
MRFFKRRTTEKSHGRGDEYHRREERKQWVRQNTIGTVNNWVTGVGVVFSILAAAGAVGAAIYARGAYVQARNQADADWASAEAAKQQAGIAQQALIDSNRPWIAAEIQQWSDLAYGPNGLTLTLAIKITNTGNAPAIGVNVSPGFLTPESFNLHEEDQIDKLRQKCGSLAKQGLGLNRWPVGGLLYPNQPSTQFITIFFPIKDIAASTAAWSKQLKAPDLAAHGIINPSIYICIDYVLPADGSHHQTGEILDIYRTNPAKPTIPWSLPPIGVPVPANLLHLEDSDEGDYAN